MHQKFYHLIFLSVSILAFSSIQPISILSAASKVLGFPLTMIQQIIDENQRMAPGNEKRQKAYEDLLELRNKITDLDQKAATHQKQKSELLQSPLLEAYIQEKTDQAPGRMIGKLFAISLSIYLSSKTFWYLHTILNHSSIEKHSIDTYIEELSQLHSNLSYEEDPQKQQDLKQKIARLEQQLLSQPANSSFTAPPSYFAHSLHLALLVTAAYSAHKIVDSLIASHAIAIDPAIQPDIIRYEDVNRNLTHELYTKKYLEQKLKKAEAKYAKKYAYNEAEVNQFAQVIHTL